MKMTHINLFPLCVGGKENGNLSPQSVPFCLSLSDFILNFILVLFFIFYGVLLTLFTLKK